MLIALNYVIPKNIARDQDMWFVTICFIKKKNNLRTGIKILNDFTYNN